MIEIKQAGRHGEVAATGAVQEQQLEARITAQNSAKTKGLPDYPIVSAIAPSAPASMRSMATVEVALVGACTDIGVIKRGFVMPRPAPKGISQAHRRQR